MSDGGFLKTDRGRIMVFVDGSNLLYTSQMISIEIDYVKLIEHLVGGDKLIRVYFYAGVDNNTNGSAGWQYFMKKKGFKLVTKALVTYPDGHRKANCDVEMAVDMVVHMDAFDTAIVLTGDGDLAYAVQRLVNSGKQVEVVGSRMNTNSSLFEAADRFVDLESMRSHISKVRDC
jgi:uncharacterized LabA/DUF88 family protein